MFLRTRVERSATITMRPPKTPKAKKRFVKWAIKPIKAGPIKIPE